MSYVNGFGPARRVVPTAISRLGVSDAVPPRADMYRTGLYAQIGKRGLDVLLSAVILMVAFPIMLVIGLVIARDGGAPIYSQWRVGRHGGLFRCHKFRTMVRDSDARLQALLSADEDAAREWAATHKLACDPRVTRIGQFLRATSLDELPQLWNVLRGEMSLVGPRPVTSAELSHYDTSAATVLSVRPGMTGLWQVTGRGQGCSYADRVKLDLEYVSTVTFRTDALIFFRTIGVVFNRTGT